jgi:hypothetical protein
MAPETNEPAKTVCLGALPPLRIAKVPPMRGVLSMLGPAFIWASFAQGSGELIWWPYLSAKYGLTFVGLLLPALAIQWFVNQEVIRYTALTGEGPWAAFGRIGKWFVVPLWILAFVSWLWFGGYAAAGGTALYGLTQFPRGWSEREGTLFWGYLTMAVFLAGLVFSRVAYHFIEWVMKAVITVTVIGLFFAIFQAQVLVSAGQFFGALVNPFSFRGLPVHWDPGDSSLVVTAIAYAGLGGFWSLLYAYWMREKGVAMSTHIGRVTSPITGKHEAVPAVGYAFEDTEENRRNWREWIRYLRIDNTLGVAINALTTVMTTWLAFALLHPKGQFPAGWKIVGIQAEFFSSVFGSIGAAIFLLVAAGFMADTWLGAVDGISRQYSDFLYSNFPWFQRFTYRSLYYAWVAFLTLATAITMPLAQPGELIIITGVISILAFVMVIPAYLYLNYLKIPHAYPRWSRPSPVTLGINIAVWLIYLSIAIWYLMVRPADQPYVLLLVAIWVIIGGFLWWTGRRQS